jgi:hypothetical protein
MSMVLSERHGSVAILTLNNPEWRKDHPLLPADKIIG